MSRLDAVLPRAAFPQRSSILGDSLYLATRGIMGSANFHSYGHEEALAYKEQGRPLVFVCWHGHDFLNLGGYHRVFGRDVRSVIMVRDDPDGMVLHRFGERMNIDVVTLPGSDPTSLQWARGVARVIGLVKSGFDALLAVDGPEGPPREVKPGAIVIAKRAGAVLVPSGAAARPSISLWNRWDHHLIPLPFCRAVMHFGPVIDPSPPTGPTPTVEELQVSIGEALTRGTRRARELVRAPA